MSSVRPSLLDDRHALRRSRLLRVAHIGAAATTTGSFCSKGKAERRTLNAGLKRIFDVRPCGFEILKSPERGK
jgi:hypothetical protein